MAASKSTADTFRWFPTGSSADARSFQKPPLKANVLSSWGYRLDPRHFRPSNFLIDRFLWHFGAVPGLCRRRQSVADQSNQRAAAAATIAAPTKEHAKAFPDPHPHLQGRIRARSLEAGYHRPFRAAQGLSDLPLVRRSRSEDHRRRSSGTGGLLYDHARPDESELQLLSRDQYRVSERL